MTEATIVSTNLRTIRRRKGLTDYELAGKINMAKHYYKKLEAGEQMPRIVTLRRIADALECEVVDFFKPSRRAR